MSREESSPVVKKHSCCLGAWAGVLLAWMAVVVPVAGRRYRVERSYELDDDRG